MKQNEREWEGGGRGGHTGRKDTTDTGYSEETYRKLAREFCRWQCNASCLLWLSKTMLQNYYSSSESNTKLKTLGCRALYQQCQYFCTFGKLSLVSMHDVVRFLRSFSLNIFSRNKASVSYESQKNENYLRVQANRLNNKSYIYFDAHG